MTSPNCVDMSKWGGELTSVEATCMAENGVRLVIPGTGHPNSLGMYSEQQAGAALAAGMDVHAYRWLNLTEPIRPQMDNAFASMGQHLDAVGRWWVDCEDVSNPGTPPEVVAKIDEAVDIVQDLGYPVGIYTGRWWWKPYTGNSKAFSHLPLWNAYYDGDPDEDGLPYGGWNHSLIEQYQGTTDLCGQSVDLNFAKLPTRPPELPDDSPWDDLNEGTLRRFEIGSLSGGPSYQDVTAIWTWARAQGYIPDRTY